MVWAASIVAARPGDRILEVGSGHGVLVGLLADAGAEVTGLDRSATMTAAARKTYGDRSALRTGRIQDAENLGPFDVVVAMRVREMWTDPEALPVVRRLLAAAGRVVLVLDSPRGPVPGSTIDDVCSALEQNGFTVDVRHEADLTAIIGSAGID